MRGWIGALVGLALVLGALWGVTRSGAARREAERAAESAAESPSGARFELDAAGAPALEAERTDEPREAQRTPLAPSFEAPAFPRSELAGRVEHADGRPAAGIEIEVRAQGASERSRALASEACSADGSFLLRCLGRGPFELRAHRSSLGGTRLQARLEGVRSGAHDLVLTLPKITTLRGRVVDDRGEPVWGFRLELESLGGLEVRQPFHDPDGRFEVAELAEGPWTLVVAARNCVESAPRALVLPLAEPLTLTLVREGTLAGVVLDPDGRPHAGARVRSEGFDTDVTDAEGAFVVRGPPGKVVLVVESEQRAPSGPLSLVLAPGEDRTGLVLTLGPSGRIDGRAVDRAEQPLAGRLALLEREGDIYQREALMARSDEEGRFTAEVAPGRWTVSLDRSRDGLEADEPLPAEVEVAAGERVEVRLSPVPRPVRLLGRITKAGAPAKIGRLSLEHSTWHGQAEVDGSDYTREVPRAGRYLLRAELEGCEQALSIRVPDAREHRFDLDVPVGWIEGRARAADGRGLAGIAVQARASDASASSTTDAEGRFALEVPPGEYRVSLEGPPDAWSSAHVEGVAVAAGERRSGVELVGLELVPMQGCSLHVRLRGPDGALLEQGRVRLEHTSSLQTSAEAKAGSAHFGGLASGSYLVRAEARGHQLLALERVELGPDEARELDLVLARGRRVFVRVHHGEAKPSDLEAIDEAGHVLALGRTQPTPGAAPDAPGVRSTWFQHHTLPPGDYLFRAWTEERSSIHPLTVPDGASEPVELELQLP
jgi:carboxypeptidase family protein